MHMKINKITINNNDYKIKYFPQFQNPIGTHRLQAEADQTWAEPKTLNTFNGIPEK